MEEEKAAKTSINKMDERIRKIMQTLLRNYKEEMSDEEVEELITSTFKGNCANSKPSSDEITMALRRGEYTHSNSQSGPSGAATMANSVGKADTNDKGCAK